MSVHAHSIAAYHAEREKLSRRASAVLKWFEDHGPATDRDCMHGLGFTDMNAVRPRITELCERGFLVEIGEKVCPVTKKRVRIIETRPAAGGMQLRLV